MSSLTDPVKILARRYAALPPRVRLAIAEKMLRWRDEEAKTATEPQDSHGARRKSLLEQFWDEVEQAHGDDLYVANPFADESPQAVIHILESTPDRCLAF